MLDPSITEFDKETQLLIYNKLSYIHKIRVYGSTDVLTYKLLGMGFLTMLESPGPSHITVVQLSFKGIFALFLLRRRYGS